MAVHGQMPWSSNATLLAMLGDPIHTTDIDIGDVSALHHDRPVQRAIYKPLAGERPLWDFPPGLHHREFAVFLLSEHLKLSVVPPTVLRDGEYGEGSVQWCVAAEYAEHYFTLYETRPDMHDQFREIALLDMLANNTDRKSGHCLVAGDRVWAIDNGLCFSIEPKLRTVIWDFAGEPIPTYLIEVAAPLCDTVPDELAELLSPAECDALQQRARAISRSPTFPSAEPGYGVPWPLV